MKQCAPAFSISCITLPVNGANAKATILTAAQAASLSAALAEDAKGAIYSAVVSIADALSSLQSGYFSWATVKLYYACFYFSRAALARRGFCTFYVGKSPFYLEARPGCSPVSQGGNSHTVVTSLYKKHVMGGIINAQPLDGLHAFDWMANRREDVNYREVKFSDPVVPAWFSNVDSYGLRRLIGDYLADPFLYAFDISHAMVALPLAALQDECKSSIMFSGLGLTISESTSLKKFLADKSGPIHHFTFL